MKSDTYPRWPSDGLFERVNANIKAQIEKVEDMTGDMDPKTNFALIVIQTELERYKFLVRSYLRARMAKVSQSLCSARKCFVRANTFSRLTSTPFTISPTKACEVSFLQPR